MMDKLHDDLELFEKYKIEVEQEYLENIEMGCTCGWPQANMTNAGHECMSLGVSYNTDPHCPMHGIKEMERINHMLYG